MAGRRLVHLVDDEEAIRKSAGFMLRTSGYAVEPWPNGAAFLKDARHLEPGCVLLDIRMPEMDGMQVLEAMAECGIRMPVVVLTGHGDVSLAVRAMKNGAIDFIEKPFEKAVLLQAVANAFKILDNANAQLDSAADATTRIAALTPREKDVLKGLARGLPNKTIAYDLGISRRTVEVYRANLMSKLQVNSFSDALRIAFAAGLGRAEQADSGRAEDRVARREADCQTAQDVRSDAQALRFIDPLDRARQRGCMKRKSGQDRSVTATWRPATRAVRGGTARSEFGETSEALFLTSGYCYDEAEEAAARFRGERPGMTYSRLQNPTVAMLEERLCLLEGAEACRVQSSGMAAMTAALLASVSAGDHVVAGRAMFGSCRWLVDHLLPRFGIETTVVDGRDTQAWAKARRPNTKVFFFETPANPTLDIIDLRAVCDLAHEAGALAVVDNAFASPILQRPMEFGADVVAYSATKHMDGQGRVLAGAVLGTAAFINDVLLPFQRNTGPNLSPFNAWVVLKSLETLELRLGRASENALAVARFLDARVPRLLYPALASHPQHALAMRQMSAGGSIMSLFLDGGRSQAHGLLDALQIIDISNNVGDSRSLMTHPASTTHASVAEAAREEMGITEGMLRLSVGLEDSADLIDDLDRALRAVGL